MHDVYYCDDHIDDGDGYGDCIFMMNHQGHEVAKPEEAAKQLLVTGMSQAAQEFCENEEHSSEDSEHGLLQEDKLMMDKHSSGKTTHVVTMRPRKRARAKAKSAAKKKARKIPKPKESRIVAFYC